MSRKKTWHGRGDVAGLDYCVGCLKKLDANGRHKCDTKNTVRRDSAMTVDRDERPRGQSVGDRIGEGFRIMEESEDGDDNW